ncbi:hypothetical protein D9M70_343770 [compost metagenome]
MALQGAADALDETGLAQFAGADVDRQHQPGPIRLPAGQAAAGAFQHPVREFEDQPGLLRQRDELRRRDLAPAGVVPAHQRFGPYHAAVGQGQLRLELQAQLVAVDGLAQLALQLQALVDGRLHFRGEEVQRIAPGLLGPVHRRIGLLEHIRRALLGEGVQGDADTGADHQLVLADDVAAVQALQQLVAHLGGQLAGLFRSVGQGLQQHHELVAAEARQGVLVAQAAGQARGDFPQQGVAHRVAEAVVDRLEVVQVDEQQGAAARFAQLAGHGVLQAVEEQAPVGQAGEFVAEGQALDFALVALPFGDVGDAQADQRPAFAGQAHQTHLAGADTAVHIAHQPVEGGRVALERCAGVGIAHLPRRPAVGLLRRAEGGGHVAVELLAGQAEQARGVLVGLDYAVLRIEQQDRLGRVLHQGAVACLGLVPGADVLHQRQQGVELAIQVAHAAHVDPRMHGAAGALDEALVQLVTVALAAAHLFEQGFLCGAVLGQGHAHPVDAAQLVAGAAEDAAELVVDLFPALVRGAQGHAHQRRLEEQVQVLVALVLQAFGALLGGQVEHRAIDADHLVAVVLGQALDPQPARGAPDALHAQLDVKGLGAAQAVFQGVFQHGAAGGVEEAQHLVQAGGADAGVQLVDTEAALAPGHFQGADFQYPTADVGDGLGLVQQVGLAQQFVAARIQLLGQHLAAADIVLQGDEVADALAVAHGRHGDLVPEQAAVLAVVAQHQVALLAALQGVLQARQLRLVAVVVQQEAPVVAEDLLARIAAHLLEGRVAVDQRLVGLARVGDGHAQGAGLQGQVGQGQLLLHLVAAAEGQAQVAEAAAHQQRGHHQQQHAEVQLDTRLRVGQGAAAQLTQRRHGEDGHRGEAGAAKGARETPDQRQAEHHQADGRQGDDQRHHGQQPGNQQGEGQQQRPGRQAVQGLWQRLHRLGHPATAAEQRRQVGQQRQADGQGGQAGAGPDQQGGVAPAVLGRVAAQQQGRLFAVDQQADRQQHAVEHETQQLGEVPQIGMAAGAPERPPAHRDAEGFRQCIKRRPVPVHVPEGHTEQGVEIDGGQYPGAPPEAEHQAEGERQVPDGQAAGGLGRKGDPGGQMQQRQGQPPGPLG